MEFLDRGNVAANISKRTFVNDIIISADRVEIGSDVMIAWRVTIVDHNSHSVSFSKHSEDVVDLKLGKKDWSHVKIAPVKILDKVWIGFNAIVLKGINIGEVSVVGAGSVVTKDVHPLTPVASGPARVIRNISEECSDHETHMQASCQLKRLDLYVPEP